MPNSIKGETPLVLSDGREFTLVADHAALIKAAQQHTGKTKLQKLFADMQPELDEEGDLVLDEDGDPVKDVMPATAAFLFGMFDAHHPEVTMREATNMLLGDQECVMEAITAASANGFGSGSDEGNVPAPKAKTQHGKRSGRSGVKRA